MLGAAESGKTRTYETRRPAAGMVGRRNAGFGGAGLLLADGEEAFEAADDGGDAAEFTVVGEANVDLKLLQAGLGEAEMRTDSTATPSFSRVF